MNNKQGYACKHEGNKDKDGKFKTIESDSLDSV